MTTITIKDLDHIEEAAREFIKNMGDDTVFVLLLTNVMVVLVVDSEIHY